MTCILKPECNFLYGYFSCLLPIETVDVEVKIKMMRGIHTFRRDQTTQVISCNPWSTRLSPYPSLIRNMRTYLELEGKLGAQHQLGTNIFLPDKNFLPRNIPVPKKVEKKRRAKVSVKRRFKVRVIAQPTNPNLPTNPTLSTEPTQTMATTMVTTPAQVARTAPTTTTTVPIIVYNLAQGKFKGIPYPIKSLQEEGSSNSGGNNPLWSSKPKLQSLPQPYRKGRTLHGLMPCQLPQMFLMLGHPSQFPQWKLPQLLKWKRQKRKFHPE